MLGQGAGNGWLMYFHSVVTASPHSIKSAFFMRPQWKGLPDTAREGSAALKLRNDTSGGKNQLYFSAQVSEAASSHMTKEIYRR